MNDTGINWTNWTWNPASGCEKISEGCKYCYAETFAEKLRGGKAFPNGFGLTLRPHKLSEPLRLRRPSLIFVNSMSDLFWEQILDDYRDWILAVIEGTPHHEYQVLTKRPEMMLAYAERRGRPYPPNFGPAPRSRQPSRQSCRHPARDPRVTPVHLGRAAAVGAPRPQLGGHLLGHHGRRVRVASARPGALHPTWPRGTP